MILIVHATTILGEPQNVPVTWSFVYASRSIWNAAPAVQVGPRSGHSGWWVQASGQGRCGGGERVGVRRHRSRSVGARQEVGRRGVAASFVVLRRAWCCCRRRQVDQDQMCSVVSVTRRPSLINRRRTSGSVKSIMPSLLILVPLFWDKGSGVTSPIRCSRARACGSDRTNRPAIRACTRATHQQQDPQPHKHDAEFDAAEESV
jgi:hypothetical protein